MLVGLTKNVKLKLHTTRLTGVSSISTRFQPLCSSSSSSSSLLLSSSNSFSNSYNVKVDMKVKQEERKDKQSMPKGTSTKGNNCERPKGLSMCLSVLTV